MSSRSGAVAAVDLSEIAARTVRQRAVDLVALVKPQFEVGRYAIGKGGIVKDAEARDAAVKDVADWIADQAGWTVSGRMESPIEGGDGNREYLIAAKKV